MKTLMSKSIKHGLRSNPVYIIWQAIKARTLNPKNKDYVDYGGRGITICDEWKKSPKAFIQYMGPRPKGYTIERINNDGNYEPGNVRWSSRIEQNRNKRNNRKLLYLGKRRCLAEISKLTNIPHSTLRRRISCGWSLARILTPRIRSID